MTTMMEIRSERREAESQIATGSRKLSSTNHKGKTGPGQDIDSKTDLTEFAASPRR
jgi:hypothetical protein